MAKAEARSADVQPPQQREESAEERDRRVRKSQGLPEVPDMDPEEGLAVPADKLAITQRVAIRPYRGEIAFVRECWLKSYRANSPSASKVPIDEYRRGQAALISKLVDEGSAFVAEHIEQKVLLGFAVGEHDGRGPVLHYVYVRRYAQRHGIGQALLDALLAQFARRGPSNAIVRYTHVTVPYAQLFGARGWAYSPYPAYRKGWE